MEKLPEGVRAQAKGFFDKLTPSEKSAVFSGKTSVETLIDQKAPFGMGGIAKGYIGSNYPGGMKALQKDITTPGTAKPQGFIGGMVPGVTDTETGGLSGSPDWGKDFRRSSNIEDRRNEAAEAEYPDTRNVFQRGAAWLAGKAYRKRNMVVPEAAGGGIRGFMDRNALERSALTSATTVRADGNVTVDVGGSSRGGTAASPVRLFADTPMMRQEAGQLTSTGPNVHETARHYMEGG